MKRDRDWIPDATDLDWIESIAAPLPPALAAIEAAAREPRVPIVDREAGRVLSVPPVIDDASSRSARPSVPPRCGWRSASRPAARS
jgi:hypothetical protein